jgi:hypothetical protein
VTARLGVTPRWTVRYGRDADGPDYAPPLRSLRAPLARTTRVVLATLVIALLGVVGVSRATASAAPTARPRPTIVLVHVRSPTPRG